MATITKVQRKTPQRLSLAAQLAHEHSMSVLKSTATFEILSEDGMLTERLIYIGKEYASKFLKAHGVTA